MKTIVIVLTASQRSRMDSSISSERLRNDRIIMPLLLPEMFESPTTATLDWEWSMMQYEDALNARLARDDEGAREAWDELEKSVVAKVADDVKVAIRGRTVELTILKKMA